MPTQPLPSDPSLEHLKGQAKRLQRAVAAGEPEALALVAEHHPGARGRAFTRADAQLVVARRYGFPSWPRLRAHLDTVGRYARSPHRQAIGGPVDDPERLEHEFLRLACLTYGADDPAAPRPGARAARRAPRPRGRLHPHRGRRRRRRGGGRAARGRPRAGERGGRPAHVAAAALPRLLAGRRRRPRALDARGRAAAARVRRRPRRGLPVGGPAVPVHGAHGRLRPRRGRPAAARALARAGAACCSSPAPTRTTRRPSTTCRGPRATSRSRCSSSTGSARAPAARGTPASRRPIRRRASCSRTCS